MRLLRASSQEKGDILRTLFSAEVWKDVKERFQERAKSLEEEAKKLSALRESLLRQEGQDTPEALAQAVEERLKTVTKPITVAVMAVPSTAPERPRLPMWHRRREREGAPFPPREGGQAGAPGGHGGGADGPH